jgi:hypothetical protein
MGGDADERGAGDETNEKGPEHAANVSRPEWT